MLDSYQGRFMRKFLLRTIIFSIAFATFSAHTLADERADKQILSAQLEIAMENLGNTDRETRRKAVEILEKSGIEALPLLRKTLQSKDMWVSQYKRDAAAYLIGQIGKPAAECVPDLIWALQNGRTSRTEPLIQYEPEPRGSAATALALVAPDDKRIIAPLIDALRNDKEYVRAKAASALGTIGPAAKAAVPELIREATESGWWVLRKEFIYALGAIGPDAAAAVPALTQIVGSSDDVAIQHEALWSLGKIGERAASAVPTLVELLKKPDPYHVVNDVAQALGMIGPAASSAIPSLIEIGKSTAGHAEIAKALGLIGPSAKDAIPLLADFMKDRSSYNTPAEAAIAILRIDPEGPLAEDAISTLINEYRSYSDLDGRLYLTEQLGSLGPAAAAALPALRKATNDDNEKIRAAAAKAIIKITQSP